MANSVRFGVNVMTLNFIGESCREVAATCKRILALSGEETMEVKRRGEVINATPDTIIQDGDAIEFKKEAGTKGADITVSVQYGVNRVQVTVADGSTVKDVLRVAAGILDVDLRSATPAINGTRVDDMTCVHAGDRIECRKDSGTKGADITVSVQYGVNRVQVTVADGSTVKDVLRVAAGILDVDLRSATPAINGSRVDDMTCVHAGDRIECRKDSGTKGC